MERPYLCVQCGDRARYIDPEAPYYKYCSNDCRELHSRCANLHGPGESFYVGQRSRPFDERHFRRTVHTAPQMQLVEMHLEPGEEIGAETHKYMHQLFFIERGSGFATLEDTKSRRLSERSIVYVPAGIRHNMTADANGPGLWMQTVYTPFFAYSFEHPPDMDDVKK